VSVRWPEPAGSVLEELEAQVRDLLGANLRGLYVYGSLAFDCYNPARSDVDVLVVTKRRMAPETRRALSSVLHRLDRVARLEISFLSRADLEPWRCPCPFDYHFSGTTEKHDGAGTYFASEIPNARARGVAIYGPPPEDVLPAVPEADFWDSLVRDIRWARDRIDEIPVYAVLNCCRTLAFAREHVILSKAEGGEWGMRELPEQFRPLAESALSAYTGPPRDDELALDEVREFVDWVERNL
jgi:predicted nucleotidyltransferase